MSIMARLIWENNRADGNSDRGVSRRRAYPSISPLFSWLRAHEANEAANYRSRFKPQPDLASLFPPSRPNNRISGSGISCMYTHVLTIVSASRTGVCVQVNKTDRNQTHRKLVSIRNDRTSLARLDDLRR